MFDLCLDLTALVVPVAIDLVRHPRNPICAKNYGSLFTVADVTMAYGWASQAVSLWPSSLHGPGAVSKMSPRPGANRGDSGGITGTRGECTISRNIRLLLGKTCDIAMLEILARAGSTPVSRSKV